VSFVSFVSLVSHVSFVYVLLTFDDEFAASLHTHKSYLIAPHDTR